MNEVGESCGCGREGLGLRFSWPLFLVGCWRECIFDGSHGNASTCGVDQLAKGHIESARNTAEQIEAYADLSVLDLPDMGVAGANHTSENLQCETLRLAIPANLSSNQ